VTSVLQQTYPHFEVIIADNASTDETKDVATSFHDPRVRYVRAQQNVGPTNNFNAGVAAADTDLVVVLSDDDALAPGFLSATTDIIASRPDVALVHTAFHSMTIDGTVLGVVNKPGSSRVLDQAPADFFRQSMRYTSIVHVSSALWRRSMAPDPPFDLRDGWADDLGFALRAGYRGSVVFLPEPLAYVAVVGDRLTEREMPERLAAMEWCEAIKLRVISERPDLSWLERRQLTAQARRLRRRVIMAQAGRLAGEGRPRSAVAELVAVGRREPRAVLDPTAWPSALRAMAAQARRSAPRA
jgi:glycosyltransferase involved in cell wall biosynthesis